MSSSGPAPQAKRAKVDQVGDRDEALRQFLDATNEKYERLHLAFEEQFWGTKMGLTDQEYTPALLTSTKMAMEKMLADKGLLEEVGKWLASGAGDDDQRKTLRILEKTLKVYIMEDAEAAALRTECMTAESELEAARNGMRLGFVRPSCAAAEGKSEGDGAGVFVEMSSVGLRNEMKSAEDEASRKAAYGALRGIGRFVCEHGFPEIIKKRNRMAKKLGFLDFYDQKVTGAEGFGKVKLFEILDRLEAGTRDLMLAARARLSKEHGADALEAWNQGQAVAGDVTAKLDPYFPFERAVETWGRCFAKMGIRYEKAAMTLDLLDRKGKYSNGFCHWPQPAWVRSDGSWQPSRTNFTSLADPSAVGSGQKALTTLMHEAGHAAHFANIKQPSPLFSQERPPTSVAYAENQSMFLDSLCGDAAWRVRYARDRQGKVMPWALHAEDLRATHPFEVFGLRAMLAVPYFEKALYELPEDEMTTDRILSLADEVEARICGGLSPRPLLSVPHILSDESSCYYHGYVLAEMSVHQTRAHFLARGSIVDNPDVGAAITKAYWRPGNSRDFLELVEGLTGKPLTAEAWVSRLTMPLEDLLQEEKRAYDGAVATMATEAGAAPSTHDAVDLDMELRICDGDEVIASSSKEGFLPACKRFATYVQARYNLA